MKPSYSGRAERYCRSVIAGEIPACKWVRLACERHLKDLERKNWPFRFDEGKADTVCAFIECLPHIKGKWGGTPIQIEDWQCFILCCVFGWVKKDSGLRRFRTVYIEVPRKNAKSTLSSGVGLYMLTEDGEEGAEVYSAATTRDQAKIVFGDAQAMVRRTPEFREAYGAEANAHTISVLKTASKFAALSSEGNTLDGLNIHCAIIDELHAHKTREVWDVIETATGARQQSLIWAITTAGSNKTGICYEQRDYVSKILDGVFEDDTYFGVIYSLDECDEWNSEAAWRKANPNYGVSVLEEDIGRLAHKAAQTPSAVNNFLTKRLNVWVNADVGLIDMAAWEKAGDKNLKPEQFKANPCWMAVDLGFVDDIAAVVKVFKISGCAEDDTKWAVFGRYYLPEDTVAESRNSQYSGWQRMGRIIATDGSVTDTDRIVDDIMDDLAQYDVRSVAFDPYNKLTIINPMQKRGVDISKMLEFPQTVGQMSPATESLMKGIRAGEIIHDGCPVLSWAMSNLVGHFDAKDNVYPRKERPENKIDPAIATIMALWRGKVDAEPQSIYSTRGLVTV